MVSLSNEATSAVLISSQPAANTKTLFPRHKPSTINTIYNIHKSISIENMRHKQSLDERSADTISNSGYF